MSQASESRDLGWASPAGLAVYFGVAVGSTAVVYDSVRVVVEGWDVFLGIHAKVARQGPGGMEAFSGCPDKADIVGNWVHGRSAPSA